MKNRTADSLQIPALVPVSGALQNGASSSQSPNSSRTFKTLAICAAVLALLPLAGCGVVSTVSSSAITSDAAITGRVHGGQQPVIGATITLYAPGTGGYGSAPSVIATTTTDNSGFFTLPRPYTCTGSAPVTYIVATGGNPGAGANPSLAEAALLPACSSLTASTYIYITEVTTVAAAYALAPFASISGTTTNIGTSPTNLLGLTNALASASNLANTTTGNAGTSASGIILPTTEINTLADILSACVNTNTVAGTSTTCSSLFTAATPPGGTAPTNTFQAAIDIALNPGNNVALLFALSTAIAPYQPTLGATAPSDFAVGIQYNGGAIAASGGGAGIDIDSAGNAWLALYGNSSVFANITEISPAGVFISGASGFLSGSLAIPASLAIDTAGNVFTVDYHFAGYSEIPIGGGAASFFQPTSLVFPVAFAVDNRNTTYWISNGSPGTTVSHIVSGGTDATNSPYGSQDYPQGVAIDNSGNVWVANSDLANIGAGKLTKFSGSGTTYTVQNFPTGTNTLPFDIALDSPGNAWVTDLVGVAQFTNAGVQLSPVGGYSQNATTSPESIIIDGLGRAWASNAATDVLGNSLGLPGSVTVFSPTGTLISTSTTTTSAGTLLGYTAAGVIPQVPFTPQGLKIDLSGDLWITGTNISGSQVVTELIGIAAPVVTPISVASSTSKLGTRP